MRAIIFFGLVQAIFCASILKRESCGDRFCFMLYAPVCGSDGVTYSNTCVFGTAQCKDPTLTIAHKDACTGGSNLKGRAIDACPLMICPAIYAPVCGTDNKTYSSSCSLKARTCNSHVTVQYSGPCTGDLLVVS